jgi:hypothetical protein
MKLLAILFGAAFCKKHEIDCLKTAESRALHILEEIDD